MRDLVNRLKRRADVARSEGTGTARGDAVHFEEAANSIEMLESRVECLGEIANVCVYEEIGRICSYCQCERKADK